MSDASTVQVTHIEPDRYVIEILSDGQAVRFEAPTAEEVIRLSKLYDEDRSRE